MTHLRSRGKSRQKRATKPKPNFASSHSAHIVMLTMIHPRARDTAHNKPAAPANLAKIGLEAMPGDQDAVQIRIEASIRDKVMTPMDGPGMTRAHIVTLTNMLLNDIGNDRTRPGTFTNILIPTTNSMKDIINSIACPGNHARKQRRA